MEIRLLSLLDGARQATGTVVIIDVYRAFTTASIALSRGAKQIMLVDNPRSALDLRQRGLGDLVMGEEHGVKVADFDFGNSPYELSLADVAGKTLIQSTSAGTKGVVAARGASAIFATALVNAAATAIAILRAAPPLVSIVAMGNSGRERTDEDEQCALYLRSLLENDRLDAETVRATVFASENSARFADPQQPHFRPQDRDIALQIDSIPLAIPVRRVGGMLVARGEEE
jgi:2-phosphosulfolactate phosphatase